MIFSPICETLGIKYPVFQGGMAWISDAALASAVSNAGGLGIISAMNADADYLKKQIEKAKALTDKPFGVNIMLMSPYAADCAKVCAEMGVKIVTTGAGSPAPYMEMWNEAGIKVIPVIASVAMAKSAARNGAFAVIAEGQESGGHIGELTTLPLVPQVCDAVDIPVLAAGGIADGRGMAAAFMLGAVGVQMGTRFLVAKECGVHQNYKDMVLKASDISTITTGKRFSGSACRQIKNPFSRNFSNYEFSLEATAEGVAELGAGALRKAAIDGDKTDGCFLAGQVSGMVNEEMTAEEIILDVVGGCEKILGGAAKWVK